MSFWCELVVICVSHRKHGINQITFNKQEWDLWIHGTVALCTFVKEMVHRHGCGEGRGTGILKWPFSGLGLSLVRNTDFKLKTFFKFIIKKHYQETKTLPFFAHELLYTPYGEETHTNQRGSTTVLGWSLFFFKFSWNNTHNSVTQQSETNPEWGRVRSSL